eukprot:gene15040-6132_t
MGPEGWTVVATSHSTRDDGHLINCFAVDAATEAVSNAARKGVCSSLRVQDDDEEEGDGDCWPTPLNTTAAATTPKRLDSFAKTPQFARRYVADWPAVSEWRVLSDSETSTTTSSCSSCFKQPCADKGIQRVGLREKIVTVACSAPAPAPAPAPPANSTKRRRIETTQGGDSSRATPSAAAAAAATAPAIFSGDPLTGRECVDIEFGSFLDVAAAAVACNEQHQLSADLGGLELYLCQCPLWTAEAAAAAAAPTTPTPTPTPSDGARQLELPLAALLADIRIPPCVDKDSLEKINIWIG